MRILLIILDGLSDLPYKILKNKTPLEAAHTPNLNFLAEHGQTGLMYPISKNIAPESDQAMLSLLGFNPFKYYTGRGPLEALGSGIKIKKNHIYIRCNFAKIKNNKILNIEAKPWKIKNKNFIPTLSHRAILIIPKNLSPRVTNTHPAYKIIKNYVTTALPRKKPLSPKKCKPLEKNAKKTASIINSFVKENTTKTSTILTRGAGNKLPKLKKLKNWALIADTPVEIGIGKLTGMKILKKQNIFNAIKKNIKKYNIYIQIKGPDKYGHLGDPIKKKKEIEKIDKLFKKLKNLKNTIICVTADHSTPCLIKAHSKHPVPLLIYGKKQDKIKKFSERACKKGSLGKILGKDLLKILKV